MNVSDGYLRPASLADVSESSSSINEFGLNLRDWQHTIQRDGIHSRPELARRLEESPSKLKKVFDEGDVADAMLAATAAWLADEAGIARPEWCSEPDRVSKQPWFGSPVKGWLLANTPAHFRQRNLFTIPEPIFTAKPGRPKVSEAQKREKSRKRQRAYRKRVAELLKIARGEGG